MESTCELSALWRGGCFESELPFVRENVCEYNLCWLFVAYGESDCNLLDTVGCERTKREIMHSPELEIKDNL